MSLIHQPSGLKKLLIVANQPSDNTIKLALSVFNGTQHSEINGIKASLKEPLQTEAEDVLQCDGIIIGSTENFGYMAGLIKDFFERIYNPCLEHTQGLPWALYVKAGNDGTGTIASINRIVTGLRWSPIQEPLLLRGQYCNQFNEQCNELGMTMAAGLDAGIY